MGKKIVVSGWYGPGNIGDEAILQAIVDLFSKEFEDCEITAFSFDPEYTKRTQKIDAVMQYPTGKRRWLYSILNMDIVATIRAIYRCDLFVMGGGGFLSDWQPAVPQMWLKQMRVAKLLGKETWLYRIGAGPFLTEEGKRRTKYYIDNFVDRVVVRDKKSYQELVENVGVSKPVEIEIDPVARMEVERYCDKERTEENTVSMIYTEYFKNSYFKLRHRPKWEQLFKAFCAQIETVIEKGLTPKLVFFQKSIEQNLADRFSNLFGEKILIEFPEDYKEAIFLLSRSKAVISFRLHGNILAYAMKKPFLPIIYHHKTAGFLEHIDYSYSDCILEVGDGENWREVEIDIEVWKKKTEKFLESTI